MEKSVDLKTPKWSGRWAAWGLMSTILLLVNGCGGPSLANLRGAVKGRVTLDGEPLQQGSIRFIPAEGITGPAAGSAIKDGAYEMTLEQGAAIGKNRIEISAARPTGKQIKSIMNDSMVDEVEEAIPEKYNKNSTLEEEIQKGTNEFNFDLESN